MNTINDFPAKKWGRHRTHKTEPHRRLGLGSAAARYPRAATTGCRLGQKNLEEFYRKKSSRTSGFRGFRAPKWRTDNRQMWPKTTKIIWFCHSSFLSWFDFFSRWSKIEGYLFVSQIYGRLCIVVGNRPRETLQNGAVFRWSNRGRQSLLPKSNSKRYSHLIAWFDPWWYHFEEIASGQTFFVW